MTIGADEIAANLERAQQSLDAADHLLNGGFHDAAASRAYYVAFYASTAALLHEGVEMSKHSGVIASVHQRLVRTGKLAVEQGRVLNTLFGLRAIGDYGGASHVSASDAQAAVTAARGFLAAVRAFLALS